jgi:hypothetical protein
MYKECVHSNIIQKFLLVKKATLVQELPSYNQENWKISKQNTVKPV